VPKQECREVHGNIKKLKTDAMYPASVPRASSPSFSGNCRAKFGRKLKNLSETTADDTDNADEETPGSAPQTPSTFHPRAQRNAFRHRDARQQSRSFSRWNQSLDDTAPTPTRFAELSAIITQYFTRGMPPVLAIRAVHG
jgi:hypothetical protein